MIRFDPRVNSVWWALRVGLGICPILPGIDKYFNFPADRRMSLSRMGTPSER